MQWTRLIRAFDLAITLPLAKATIPATRAIHTTSSTQVQAPTPDVLPPISTPTRLIASDSPVESTPATESEKSTKEVPVEPAPTAAVVHAVEVAPIIPVRVPAQVAPVVVAPTVASPVPSPWSAVVASQNDRSNEAPDKPLLPAESRPRMTPKMREADWVLVVDDSATVREFMKGRLAPFGFNVDYAASGEEAIGLTGKRFYTCIFLDVVMPGADGYQVCKMIKSIRGVRKSSIVMLTSRGSPFDKIRGTMAGCDAYLTKPLDEDKLLHTIGKLLPNAVATA